MSRTSIGSTRNFRQYFINFDKFLLLLVVLALAVGFLAINSATLNNEQHDRFLYRQSVAVLIGFAGFFFFSFVDYNFMARFSPQLAIGSFVLLLITAWIAPNIDGNRNWIMIGSFNLQPSELTKICFIVSMSYHLSKLGKEINRPLNLLKILGHFALYLVPIAMQGDIGTCVVYCVMFFVLLLVAGLKGQYFLAGGIALFAAVPVVWSFLKDYHKRRIIYGFRPDLDPLKTGFQPLISRMAIGSGGLTGLGYGHGIQSQNGLLPALHTDFIYAVIGEECGFFGCFAVLLLLAGIVLRCFRCAVRAKDNNGFLICVATGTMVLAQTLINIGMCIGVSPVIGITLPFVSYGGSSIMSAVACMGLVMSVCVKPDTALKFGSDL